MKKKVFIIFGIIIVLFIVINIIKINNQPPQELSEKLSALEPDLKKWLEKGGNPMMIMPLMKKLQENIKAKKFLEAEKIINEIRKNIKSDKVEEFIPKELVINAYEKIIVADSPPVKNGYGDPSLEYGPDGTGWMTYTLVDVQNGVLTTHLAKSDNNGKTWKFVKKINQPSPDIIEGVEGNWVHETSSIVYNPNDVGQEWKIFWFRYFRAKGLISQNTEHTWLNSGIVYKYASDPEGGWSEEIPVFGMGNFRDNGIDIRSMHSDLKDLVFFYEIGSIYKKGKLYLSLEGSSTPTGMGEWGKRKIILMASYDHEDSWEYVGTLTDYDDAKEAGYLTFTASSLVEENGRIFLLVSPSGKLSDLQDPEGHHDGTDIFEFEDITKAKLKRDSNGKLILIKHVDDVLIKGGQADYDEENTNGGIVYPQQDLEYFPEVFQLFSTKEKIVE